MGIFQSFLENLTILGPNCQIFVQQLFAPKIKVFIISNSFQSNSFQSNFGENGDFQFFTFFQENILKNKNFDFGDNFKISVNKLKWPSRNMRIYYIQLFLAKLWGNQEVFVFFVLTEIVNLKTLGTRKNIFSAPMQHDTIY